MIKIASLPTIAAALLACDLSGGGISVLPIGSAPVTGVLSKVTTNNNSFGIFVNGSATTGASLNVTFVDSEASSNSNIGVLALSNPGTAATAVMLRNSRCQQQRYRT
jgi:hypothetical protein